MKSDNTCCKVPAVHDSSRLKSLTSALLSDRQWWLFPEFKKSTHFNAGSVCSLSFLRSFIQPPRKQIYFTSSLFLEAICKGAIASEETMLTHFPAAGWLFSTLIIQSTCLSPGPPLLLIPLPPCALLPPPSIYSISMLRRCKFITVAAAVQRKGGGTQCVLFQNNYWTLTRAYFFHFAFCVCDSAV